MKATFSEAQLQSMDYYTQLLPLYKELRVQGIISPNSKLQKRRVQIEKQILASSAGMQHPSRKFNPDRDPDLLLARAKTCESYLESQQQYIANLESQLQKSKKTGYTSHKPYTRYTA